MLSASDAAAELVQLAQAEALGIFHYHQRRVRHVHADFDDRRGHENIQFTRGKIGHDPVLVLRLHLAVHTADAQIGKRGGQFLRVLLGGLELDGQLVVFLDHRAHDEHLPPLADESADEIVEPRAV